MKLAIVKYNAGNTVSVINAINRLGIEGVVTDSPEELLAADKVIFPGVGEASTAMSYLRKRGLDEVIRSLTQPVLGICLGMQLMCSFSEENDTECLGILPYRVRSFESETMLTKCRSPRVGTGVTRKLSVTPSLTRGSLQQESEAFVEESGVKVPSIRKLDVTPSLTRGPLQQESEGLVAESRLKVPHTGWNRIQGLKSPLFNGVAEGSHVYFVHGYYVETGNDTTATTEYGSEFSAGVERDNFHAIQFHPEKSGEVGARILENFLTI